VKARVVEAAEHPALEQAITYAVRRPLASAFGFERRRVPVDMSPLNAAAFGLWALRQHEAAAEPGVWVICPGYQRGIRRTAGRPAARSRLPRAAPSERLQAACSGPVHAARSGVWPRSQPEPGGIHRVGIRHAAAWHQACPAATFGAHRARSFWWAPP
jgi:hypothetical protein